MQSRILVAIVLLGVLAFVVPAFGASPIEIAQISDTHLGDSHAPHAADNLRKAVEMINERRPDAVVLSGDIGERERDWQQAKTILKALNAPLYYVPGNHDVHTHDVEKYRRVFGRDYYRFRVRDVEFVVIDSQLLGNFDKYEGKFPAPLPPETEAESDRMLSWLETQQQELGRSKVVIGIQHIPVFHDKGFPDPKPYWVISDPYRSREMKLLHKLGIKDMLVGHWHNGRVFDREGITWHVAPATSWLPWGGSLGFAMHTITPDGKVRTEFVNLPDAQP
jgi:3',5'-cyclic-AMP phosphodiesterase